MGSWILDYIENWAGEGNWTGHLVAQYRNPAFVGDITVLSGEVTEVVVPPVGSGRPFVTVAVEMRTQTDAVMAVATAEVYLQGAAR
jgi:hypothetical protein